MNNEIDLVAFFTQPHFRLNKNLLKVIGIDACLYLSNLIGKFDYFKKNNLLDGTGFFFQTQKQIEEETTLTPKQQSVVLKNLSEKNMVIVKKKGIPAKNYYKINFNVITSSLNLESPVSHTGMTDDADRNDKRSLIKESKEEIDILSKERSISDSEESQPLPIPFVSNSGIENKKVKILKEEPKELPRKIGNRVPLNQETRRPNKDLSKPDPVYTDEAHRILNYWNKFKDNPTHKTPSTGTQKALKMLDEKILKKYKEVQVTGAMTTMLYMRSYREKFTTAPPDKLSLLHFLGGNGYSKSKSKIIWFNKLVVPGGFKEFLKKPDDNPDVTRWLKEMYAVNVLKNKDWESVPYSFKQNQKFVEAAEKAVEFYDTERLQQYVYPLTMKEFLVHVFMALREHFGETSKINVGNLSSDYTWNDIMPKYVASYDESYA